MITLYCFSSNAHLTCLYVQCLTKARQLLDPGHHWVIKTSSPALSTSMFSSSLDLSTSMFSDLDLPITSNVLTTTGSYAGVVSLQDVYRPAPHLPLRLPILVCFRCYLSSHRSSGWGVWEESHGLVELYQERWERRQDLTGVGAGISCHLCQVTLSATSLAEPPFVVTSTLDASDPPPGMVGREGRGFQGQVEEEKCILLIVVHVILSSTSTAFMERSGRSCEPKQTLVTPWFLLLTADGATSWL